MSDAGIPNNVTDLRAWSAAHFPSRCFDCGEDRDPGLKDTSEWRDWSHQPTTPDQSRIEACLDRLDLTGKRILHVGSGNSQLARRFAGRAGAIVGLTVVAEEKQLAESLSIPGYTCLLRNKYDVDAVADLGLFDLIVDNNPSTFACCMRHLMAMFASYRDALVPDGMILTDRQGLGHALPDASPNAPGGLSFAEFRIAVNGVELDAWRISRHVYAAAQRRPSGAGLRQRISALYGRIVDRA